MKTTKAIFPVLGMGCTSCAAKIEKVLNDADGVVFAAVNYAAATVAVEYHPLTTTPGLLHEIVQKAGYDLLTTVSDEALFTIKKE
jgi:Cu2+-exporting ATPase